MAKKNEEKKYRIVEIGSDDACKIAHFNPVGQIGTVTGFRIKDNGYSTCHFHFDKPFMFFNNEEGVKRMCFWDVKLEEVNNE